MRPVRKITAEEENFRVERFEGFPCGVIKRDPVEPAPVGTIIIKAFKVTGYVPDCDGSLMAQLENVDKNLVETGWSETNVGICSNSTIEVYPGEWQDLFND